MSDPKDPTYLSALEKKLLRKNPKYAYRLLQRCREKSAHGLEELIYDFYAAHSKEHAILAYVLHQQLVDSADSGGDDDPTNLILNTPFSPFGIMLRHVAALKEVRRYLEQIVGPVILDVCALDTAPGSISADCKYLVSQCDLLIDTMTKNGPKTVPIPIRKLLVAIFSAAKTLGQLDAMEACASALLGRLIGDSLIAVFESYGDNDECSGLYRKLRICRLILRSVARVDLDPELIAMTDARSQQMVRALIDKCGSSVQKFVEKVSDPNMLVQLIQLQDGKADKLVQSEERSRLLVELSEFCAENNLTSYHRGSTRGDDFSNSSSASGGGSPRGEFSSMQALFRSPNFVPLEPVVLSDDEEHASEPPETPELPAEYNDEIDLELEPADDKAQYYFDIEEDIPLDHMLGPELTSENLAYNLVSSTGETKTLSQVLLSGRLVLLVMLRHFGCNMCRRTATEFSRHFTELNDAGIKMIAVGNGSFESAKQFAAEVSFPGELYIDSKLKLYEALECHRGNWRSSLFNTNTVQKFFGAISAGFRPRGVEKGADALQLGGSFLIYNQKRILFARREEFAGDVNVPEVVSICVSIGTKPVPPVKT